MTLGAEQVATVLAVAINQPLVGWFDEPRPYTTLPDLLVLAQRSTDPSFPPDHAVMAGAVATGLGLVSWRLGALAAVAALVMGFARVYVAANYPHDVIVGLALGAAMALATHAVLAPPADRCLAAADASPAGPRADHHRRPDSRPEYQRHPVVVTGRG